MALRLSQTDELPSELQKDLITGNPPRLKIGQSMLRVRYEYAATWPQR